jgi:twitching motility protein PilU
MDLKPLLSTMVERKASDLFITVGVPPTIKCHGVLIPIGEAVLSALDAEAIVLGMMTEEQKNTFHKTKEMNFALQLEDLGRFRASAFQQRLQMGVVLRRIENKIPTVEQLRLPKILEEFSLIQRGLIIIVGATGTGKSTTLAAMIGYRNRNKTGHIISIEDPIEYLHSHEKCIITQREVGVDTESFETALKNALRQAPDVIFLGEIRSKDTMNYALAFSETGHLCLATLHANNANQAIDRITSFFSAETQKQIWMDLSLNLRAIVAQQLIPSLDGQGRIPAVEIMVNSPVMSDHIRNGEVHLLKEFMKKSSGEGMQTFDQHLFQLFSERNISEESALRFSDSENEMRLNIKLSKGSTPGSSMAGVNVMDDLR